MQLITLAAGLVSLVASASALACTAAPTFPDCAAPCITSAVSAIGCTAVEDFGCQCRSASALGAKASGCIIGNCGVMTAMAVQMTAASMCSACAPAMPTAMPGSMTTITITAPAETSSAM